MMHSPDVRPPREIRRRDDVPDMLHRWICQGMKRSGNGNIRPCRTVLMEVSLTAGTFIRIRCPECGTWSVWDAMSRDTHTEREGSS